MTTEEIRQIIAGGETLHAEFKSATVHPDALAAALVSFLNTEGGVLLLGVEDDGDESAVMETGLDDVDLHTFDDFLSLAYGYPADETRTAAERARLLRNLKAMRGDELTVAGLLFFGRRPQDYLPTP
jgi:predicted HTH transcriptional regulator